MSGRTTAATSHLLRLERKCVFWLDLSSAFFLRRFGGGSIQPALAKIRREIELDATTQGGIAAIPDGTLSPLAQVRRYGLASADIPSPKITGVLTQTVAPRVNTLSEALVGRGGRTLAGPCVCGRAIGQGVWQCLDSCGQGSRDLYLTLPIPHAEAWGAGEAQTDLI